MCYLFFSWLLLVTSFCLFASFSCLSLSLSFARWLCCVLYHYIYWQFVCVFLILFFGCAVFHCCSVAVGPAAIRVFQADGRRSIELLCTWYTVHACIICVLYIRIWWQRTKDLRMERDRDRMERSTFWTHSFGITSCNEINAWNYYRLYHTSTYIPMYSCTSFAFFWGLRFSERKRAYTMSCGQSVCWSGRSLVISITRCAISYTFL